MVRALWDNSKTMTRRILKPQPTAVGTTMLGDAEISNADWQARTMRASPIKHNVGDRLWVREAYRLDSQLDAVRPAEMSAYEPVHYEADGIVRTMSCAMIEAGRLRASMHMPRWASRITLIVTGVKVERLQDIPNEDAIAEGVFYWAGDLANDPKTSAIDIEQMIADTGERPGSPRAGFAALWQSVNGPGAWGANPYVAAYTFTAHRANIDHL